MGGMRTGVIAAVTAGVLVVGGAAGGGLLYVSGKADREADAAAEVAVDSLATAWGQRDVSNVTFADPAVGESFTAVTEGLGDAAVTVRPGSVARTDDTATTDLTVTWNLPGDVPWDYTVPLQVEWTGDSGDGDQPGGRWAVTSPADGQSLWAPGLEDGQTLSVGSSAATRGDLLDRAGEALMPLGTVYPVQLDPTRATAKTAADLEKLVDVDRGSLVKKLAAAKKSDSKAPIPVITYREADFDERRAQLDALIGVIYPETEQPLGRSRTFGQPLLGSFGDVTAEMVESSDGRYAAGDRAGLSGLQRQYDGVLAGTPGVTVETDTGKALFEKAPVDGADVTVTLDPDVQEAAESALSGTGSVPSGMVAVDVKTGDILAAANNPAFGFDRALTGQFPPGSAFKVATTYALLTGDSGVTPATSVACPANLTVDGRSYKNFEGESASGSPTFLQDFARSCNTAFISLADKVGDTDLSEAAQALGIGAEWGPALGVSDAFAGSVPKNNGATDKASAMIGQGRNLASPAALAVMAGSVARGSYVQPALVTDPAPEGVDRKPVALDEAATGTLRELMGEVVAQGSGTILQGTPGGRVSGKSGTAEFGDQTPPETHAWFIGFQGDVAFAVIVEEGRSGGSVAAPIAKAFLTGLAGG